METFFEKHKSQFDKWFEGEVTIRGIKKTKKEDTTILCLSKRFRSCNSHTMKNGTVFCMLEKGYCNHQRLELKEIV